MANTFLGERIRTWLLLKDGTQRCSSKMARKIIIDEDEEDERRGDAAPLRMSDGDCDHEGAIQLG